MKNDELTVVLLNYGARLHQIFAPDNKGHLENVLLSYDELSDVLTDESFFGATVGPVAGRIRNATWGNHQLEKTPATTISTEEQMDGLSNIGMSKCSKIHSRSALSFIYKTLFPDYPGPITATITYQLTANSLEMITKRTVPSRRSAIQPIMPISTFLGMVNATLIHMNWLSKQKVYWY